MSKLVASERERLLGLSAELHRRIVGQEDAVNAVATAVQRSRCGGGGRGRPAQHVFGGGQHET